MSADPISAERRRLERLYATSADRALGYLVRMVGDRAWAEDLLQEAFLRVSRRMGEVPDGGVKDAALASYLYRTATHLAIDGLRSKRRAAIAAEHVARAGATDIAQGPDPAAAHETSDLAAAARRALDALPPRPRAAVILRVVLDMTFEEVGEALGVTDRAASRIVRLALERVRRRLGAAEPAPKGPEPRGTHVQLRT